MKIFTDGASKGNPGNAGIGVVIEINDDIFKYKKYIGKKTNNEAEYIAVLYAITLLLAVKNVLFRYSDSIIKLFTDSELVVKQLNGIYKINSNNLKKYYDKINMAKKELYDKYRIKMEFYHISRKNNKLADKLANEAIYDKEGENNG